MSDQHDPLTGPDQHDPLQVYMDPVYQPPAFGVGFIEPMSLKDLESQHREIECETWFPGGQDSSDEMWFADKAGE